jgi:hypothetical protein
LNKAFLINRLRQMSIPEILYRFHNEMKKIVDKATYKNISFNEIKHLDEGILFKDEISLDDTEFLIKLADEVCENKIDIFSLKNFNIGEKINYHKDYKSGKAAPDNVFGKSIDYRNSDEIGDIKYIWEPNRQLFILVLALTYHVTNNKKYMDKLQQYLEEWIKQNPFMLGVNWCSSLELGIRIINWSLSFKILSNRLDGKLKKKILDSVYKQCWYIDRNYSKYSSANNHLIGEAAGVFIAAVLLPKVKESTRWIEKARTILEKESELQNYSDGVNKEQAISYEQFVFDFLLIAGLVGRNNGYEFTKGYWNNIIKMYEFTTCIANLSYDVPHYGDEDDGFVIDIGQKKYGTYKSITNTMAVFLGREELLSRDWSKDIKTKFLLSIMGKEDSIKINEDYSEVHKGFDKGGYFILSHNRGKSEEQMLVFDCGSLGYLSLAAHGHADALSFWFSARGIPIFIDPGTYAYHTEKKWRDYFRGTSAHNTVRIDGVNQSSICGNFMWNHKAKSYLKEYVRDVSVSGYHDGYERLSGKVRHERKIGFLADENCWYISDNILGVGSHLAELYFHLNPKCKATKVGENSIKIEFGVGNVFLQVHGGDTAEIIEGSVEPILGWYSSSYDVKVPTKTIVVTKKFSDKTKFYTKFRIENE